MISRLISESPAPLPKPAPPNRHVAVVPTKLLGGAGTWPVLDHRAAFAPVDDPGHPRHRERAVVSGAQPGKVRHIDLEELGQLAPTRSVRAMAACTGMEVFTSTEVVGDSRRTRRDREPQSCKRRGAKRHSHSKLSRIAVPPRRLRPFAGLPAKVSWFKLGRVRASEFPAAGPQALERRRSFALLRRVRRTRGGVSPSRCCCDYGFM